eukprot:3899106-Pyramimonas_sp.AAC.2
MRPPRREGGTPPLWRCVVPPGGGPKAADGAGGGRAAIERWNLLSTRACYANGNTTWRALEVDAAGGGSGAAGALHGGP